MSPDRRVGGFFPSCCLPSVPSEFIDDTVNEDGKKGEKERKGGESCFSQHLLSW